MTQRRRQHGLTLVELMVSLALSAVLIVAVLESLAGLRYSDQALSATSEAQWRADRLESLLRRDLERASEVSFGAPPPSPGGGQVSLAGLVLSCRTLHCIDLDSGQERQLPCQVSYGLATVAGRPWLCRQQVTPVAGPEGGTRVEPIDPDLRITNMQAPGSAAGGVPQALPAGQALPAAVVITAQAGSGNGSSWQWTMGLR